MSKNDDVVISDIVSGNKGRGWKILVIVLGVIVYVGGIVYAAASNFGLLVERGDSSLRFWMAAGVIMQTVSAVALPLALHYWAVSGLHRMSAITFYALELLLLGFNAVVEFRLDKGYQIDGTLAFYLENVAPMLPILVMCAWGILLVLDPEHQFDHKLREMAQGVKLAKVELMKAKLDNNIAALTNGAANDARDMVESIAGNTAPVVAYARDAHAMPQAGGGMTTQQPVYYTAQDVDAIVATAVAKALADKKKAGTVAATPDPKG